MSSNHYDLIPQNVSPEVRAALMRAMDDPANEGAFGKYASDDLRQQNVDKFLQGQGLGYAGAGHGGWLGGHGISLKPSDLINPVRQTTNAAHAIGQAYEGQRQSAARISNQVYDNTYGRLGGGLGQIANNSYMRHLTNMFAGSAFSPEPISGGYMTDQASLRQRGATPAEANRNLGTSAATSATALVGGGILGAGAGGGGVAGTSLTTGSQLGNAAVNGALQGAVQGGAGAAINGGNVLQGAGTGALTGAVGSGVGGYVGGATSGLGSTASHALAGAASGAATGALGPALNGGNSGDIWRGGLTGGAAGGVGGGAGAYTNSQMIGSGAGNLTGQLVSSLLQPNPQQPQGYPQQPQYQPMMGGSNQPPPSWTALMQSMQGYPSYPQMQSQPFQTNNSNSIGYGAGPQQPSDFQAPYMPPAPRQAMPQPYVQPMSQGQQWMAQNPGADSRQNPFMMTAAAQSQDGGPSYSQVMAQLLAR